MQKSKVPVKRTVKLKARIEKAQENILPIQIRQITREPKEVVVRMGKIPRKISRNHKVEDANNK